MEEEKKDEKPGEEKQKDRSPEEKEIKTEKEVKTEKKVKIKKEVKIEKEVKTEKEEKKPKAGKSKDEKLEFRLEVIRQIKQVRREQHMTQEVLAQRAGTQKSNISRLESGKYNPSLDLLVRVAGCLGKRLHIWME